MGKIKIAFFDAKDYDKDSFITAVQNGPPEPFRIGTDGSKVFSGICCLA